MRPVIINCDPGIDDSLAIMLAVLSKRLKVVGITTTFGNASVEHTTENALGIVEYLGADIPVAKGANGPIKGRRINANYVHGNNGLAGIRLPHRAKAVAESAEDFIIDRVKAGDVDTIISTAPLTNIAKAFMKDARAMRRLKKLVIMGGTVTEPGSVTRVAEFNFFGDPYAAEYVNEKEIVRQRYYREVVVAPGYYEHHQESYRRKGYRHGVIDQAVDDTVCNKPFPEQFHHVRYVLEQAELSGVHRTIPGLYPCGQFPVDPPQQYRGVQRYPKTYDEHEEYSAGFGDQRREVSR